MKGAVFGPVQIRQLLKPRPPTLQIVIIQVRLCCDRLQGTQRPSQRSSAFISVDLNGVVRRCCRVAVGLRDSSLNEVIDVDTVGCRTAAAWPEWILELWFDVLSWQKTVGTIWVLYNWKENMLLLKFPLSERELGKLSWHFHKLHTVNW